MHNRNPLTKLITRGTRPLVKTAVAATMLGTFATPALADPPADGSAIPVFCFRIMDIQQTGTDQFRFEIEVLNWTDTPADDLAIAIADASEVTFVNGSGAVNPSPTIPAGGGNQVIPNNWAVDPLNNSTTAIHWDGGTAIPNIDLVDIALANPNDFPAQVSDVNALTGPGGHFPAMDFNPGLPETIDNGTNVLGGFVFEVDDFQAGEILSFNWFLTDNGQPLGTADGAGNAFGFGNINLTWVDDGNFPGPVFPQFGNTGFRGGEQALALFAPGAGIVNLEPGSPDGFSPTNVAEFGMEIGAGITPPFMNPGDSEAICNPGGCPITGQSTSVPEPETQPLALLGLATVMGIGSLIKGQRHKTID